VCGNQKAKSHTRVSGVTKVSLQCESGVTESTKQSDERKRERMKKGRIERVEREGEEKEDAQWKMRGTVVQ